MALTEVATPSLHSQEQRREASKVTLVRRLQRLVCSALAMGAVPRHVAFIMDGNRRYASAARVDRAQGHAHGFEKLLDALEWCFDLGVSVVTVYAFSIENFKRSPDEVASLMALARDKLGELERRLLAQAGSCSERARPRIRVVGDLQLLPPDVRVAAARVMTASRQGECGGSGAARQRPRPVVNLCVAYTGREDLAQAAQRCAEGVARGWLQPGDVGEDALEACLHTSRLDGPDMPCLAPRGRHTASPLAACLDEDNNAALVTGHVPVDLLIRTSGEHRLSDFAVAQCGHAQLHFTTVLWPDLGFTHLAAALLRYQAQAAQLQRRTSDALQARRAARERAHLLALRRGGGGVPAGNGHVSTPPGDDWRSGAAVGSTSLEAAAFSARFGSTDTCREDVAPAMPPPTPAEEATLHARAQGAAARVAAFLQERERALRAWEAAVAEGRLAEWPPPLGPRRQGSSKTTCRPQHAQ